MEAAQLSSLSRQLVASKQHEDGSATTADLSRRSPAKQDEDGLTDPHPIILTKSVNFFPV
jgi:hypothetical protein